MVLECQQHPDYHEAITTLLDLADEYGKHSKHNIKSQCKALGSINSSIKE